MNIYVSGINYKTTPLEIREMLSFNNEGQRLALGKIYDLPCIDECAILSTCNRTEVYVYSESCSFDNGKVEEMLCEIKGLNIYNFKKYFYFYNGAKAVKHLLKVASGLDSAVLGEDQILGQVKDANELSLEMGTSSSVLNKLFRDTITSAKKVKTNTELSKNSVSVGSLAVKLLLDIFQGNMQNKCALVIGTGKIGSIAIKNLYYRGIGKIYVTNRSHDRAEDLSKMYSNIQLIEPG
ncbi:MAG: glutamyl-tRNA reductase [Candidatus Humimicrobiaceae bacterium]